MLFEKTKKEKKLIQNFETLFKELEDASEIHYVCHIFIDRRVWAEIKKKYNVHE